MRISPLEPEPERQLDQSLVVDLRAYDSKLRVRGRGIDQARVAELHAVEQVEDFGAELQPVALRDPGPLEEGEIEVVDPVPADNRVGAAFRAEVVGRRNGEARRIKPLIQPRLRGTVDLLLQPAATFGRNPPPCDCVRFGVAVKPRGKPS
jgi:hypothetical protein